MPSPEGPIAVFDRQLVSRFEWLRGRPKDATATPPLLMAFDCLYARGYEGLVGKDEASPYVEGRTLAWLKVKVLHYREGERGWTPGNKS